MLCVQAGRDNLLGLVNSIMTLLVLQINCDSLAKSINNFHLSFFISASFIEEARFDKKKYTLKNCVSIDWKVTYLETLMIDRCVDKSM